MTIEVTLPDELVPGAAEIAMINEAADELNREAEDVLEYQAVP